ncbi:MAG: OmpA family protein [Lachnospiraceae bacterium]|nr:OmpA family protein [Lachnospiraceae bacterium]
MGINKKLSAVTSGMLAIILSASASISLGGCGSDSGNTGNTATAPTVQQTESETENTTETEGTDLSDSDTFFPYGEAFYDGRFVLGELAQPEQRENPAKIYENITYTPQMFYGDYRLNHPNDGVQTSYASRNFLNTCEWTQGDKISTGLSGKIVSAIPYRIVAGNAELDIPLITDTNYNWCQVYYAVNGDERDGAYIDAAFTVEGNTITFTPVSEWSFDEATAALDYKFEDKSISYTFSFLGPKLTLSTGESSYTLIERDFTSWRSYVEEESLSVSASLSENSRTVDDIVGIDMCVSMDSNGNLNPKKSSFTLKINENGTEKNYNGVAKWDEDGLFTFSYVGPSGETKSHQMVMFYCGFDGVILSDGKKNYYYLSTFLSEASVGHYTIEDLGANVSEEDAAVIENLTDEEIEEIIETRDNLLEDFEKAFTENGIAAKIQEETGEIILDSSILFATGDYTLSDDGKNALNAFITAFSGVIDNEKYKGFISKVEVGGHTDTDGAYDYNLDLSQKRADSVKDYCLTEAPLTEEIKNELSTLLVPVGYAYDKPIYKENGDIDMDASRRVEFVFYINLAAINN